MESDDILRPETGEFVSKSYGASRRVQRAFGLAAHSKTPGNGGRAAAGRIGLIIRLGACALLFCGALALRLNGDEASLAAVSAAAYGEETETDEEDTLGRLRFVALPSIIDVFAPSREAILPVDALSFSTEEEGRLLVLSVRAGENVVSPAKGSVCAIGGDGENGVRIVIRTEDDREFALSGIGTPAVELGQPVKQGQKLAEAAGDRLFVRVTRGGRPVEPAEAFGLGKDR